MSEKMLIFVDADSIDKEEFERVRKLLSKNRPISD
jgi:hypothetical protein